MVGHVRLAQVSDVHVGAADRSMARALLEDLAALAPHATIVCGDLTMRARSHQFGLARTLLEAMPQPVLVVPGNHDIPLINLAARMAHPYDAYQETITEDLDPRLDIPGARILGLNTMPRWRWKAGRASRRQCQLVKTELGSAPAGCARILVTHHPVLPKDLSPMTGRSALVQAAARAEVDLLLSGHTHDPLLAPVLLSTKGTSNNALSSVAGTAISDRLRNAANSYVALTIDAESIHAEVRASTGGAFEREFEGTFPRRSR
jgi:3',5'-cyclic AMP phosphodiesterase CpdA